MAYDQAAADWQREANQAQERIAAVLADLDAIGANVGTDVNLGSFLQRTHSELCWRWHIGCLSVRIRRVLCGEEGDGSETDA